MSSARPTWKLHPRFLIGLFVACLRNEDGRIISSCYSLRREGDAKGAAMRSIRTFMTGIIETHGLKAIPLTEVSLVERYPNLGKKHLSVTYYVPTATGRYTPISTSIIL